jgi:hypothetical protein
VSAALGVGAGAWVVAEAAKNDNVERIVGSTVTATIEPVSVGGSAAGGDRRGAAEVREGGLDKPVMGTFCAGSYEVTPPDRSRATTSSTGPTDRPKDSNPCVRLMESQTRRKTSSISSLAYGNSHGAWVATGGLRHPRPELKHREPGLFGLVLATSGAVARTAVVACRRFLQDS